MQLLRSIAGQLFIVIFIHSFHNVKIQAHPQSVLTASASSIREEESVTLQCSAKAGHTPKKCYIYWLNQAKEQKHIAFDCQVTFTGSDLLARTGAHAEVKVQCFYTVDRRIKDEPAPHSDIVSITVRRVVTGSPTPARPTPASPTPARPTPASPTPARPTPARPTSARPTPASPTPASSTSASPTTAAITVVNPTLGTPLRKFAVIRIVYVGVFLFLIILLLAILHTWRRRKSLPREQKCLSGAQLTQPDVGT